MYSSPAFIQIVLFISNVMTVNHQVVTALAENELHAFGEAGLLLGCMKVFWYVLIYLCWLGFYCWKMLISALLSKVEGGEFFSPPVHQAVQLSSLMQRSSTGLELGRHFKWKAYFLCLSVARFVEGIANIAERALKNFRFFSISYLIGKMWLKCPFCYEVVFMGFVIEIDTVLLFVTLRNKM